MTNWYLEIWIKGRRDLPVEVRDFPTKLARDSAAAELGSGDWDNSRRVIEVLLTQVEYDTMQAQAFDRLLEISDER